MFRTKTTIIPWFMAILLLLGLSYITTRMFKDSLPPSHMQQPYKMQNSIPAEAKNSTREEMKKATKTCIPRRKYVFIAPHKVGTSTTSTIFRRYARSHELAMLIPKEGIILSWATSPAEEDYIHTPDEQYDALFNHFTYNKTWLRSKFPDSTAYISIIREPSKQLRSFMKYYSLPQLLKIKSTNPLKTFLENPWKYKKQSEAYFQHCNVIFDPTRNFMSFDLGYPAEGAEDEERARRYISELEADFTLIMLLEYLDESLLLLRRLMCWELEDIIYVTNNNRSYSYKEYVPSKKELTELRQWKAVDYLLYDTFNKSLWQKITAQGPDFFEELHFFKEGKNRVNKYCRELKKGEPNFKLAASKWNPQFEINNQFCHAIRLKGGGFLKPMQEGHESGRRKILAIRHNLRALTKGQQTFKYVRDMMAKKRQ
ncbi:galactosylceramide sulfotransferase-like [Branchiostoma lanceolatum]|uniref:galactosylceramide sulfotransferase-like n=1 Tax=Branchiostoma lanceolatum TaxID=7740 RepID=UPI0034556C3F